MSKGGTSGLELRDQRPVGGEKVVETVFRLREKKHHTDDRLFNSDVNKHSQYILMKWTFELLPHQWKILGKSWFLGGKNLENNLIWVGRDLKYDLAQAPTW